MPFQSSHLLVSQIHYKDGDVPTMVLQIFMCFGLLYNREIKN